ncbi:MAG: polysaccharide export protein [Chthonomonas sp.]|nr:polysaccharide export protein [Chthonomonas sp.]
MLKLRLFWIIGLFALLANVALAQAQEAYRLQPEDVIRIQVFDETQIVGVTAVGKDGNVTAPFLGLVRAEGLTTNELEAVLVKEYQRVLRIREPRVSVTIERFREIRASITGMVNRPGAYPVRPTDDILTLLALGGNAILERADLRRAKLQRAGSKEVIPVDLYAMLTFGDLSQNYTLMDGDILSIPEDKFNVVNVLGAVQQPFSFPYREGMTLVDAIAQARGDIPYRSAFSKITVYRENKGAPGTYTVIRSNLSRFFKNGDSSQNIKLAKGDIIFVPESNTPDVNRISSVANTAANFIFILERFGLRIF